MLVASGTVIIFLLFLLFITERNGRRDAINRVSTSIQSQNTTECPLCGSKLVDNKRVKSVLFPGKPDSMMEINGCPYCYPVNSDFVRICPVCKNEVPHDGHVIARVFMNPGKKHVHVLGCTECYKRKTP